jgi:hypothetical protein
MIFPYDIKTFPPLLIGFQHIGVSYFQLVAVAEVEVECDCCHNLTSSKTH